MKRTEIGALNNKVVTEEQLEEINLHEEVEKVEGLGASSSYPGYEWFSIEFHDGTSVDVFCKF